MKVGVLGTGDVGKALGNGFLALGHEVKLGSRDAGKAGAWAKAAGGRASAGSFAETAAFGEVLVLATLGVAATQALDLAGPQHFKDKLVIDTTNPLDFSAGFPPRLAITGYDSGGEQIQRALPGARVVKAWNTVGHAHMFRPQFPDGPPDMFICGNDAAAKQQMKGILDQFGWGTVDVGNIEAARYLEAMCLVWVLYGASGNTWNHAFKLLRK